MTSSERRRGGRPVDLDLLLDAFTSRLETRIEALFGGRFDAADWVDRQITTGRPVEIVRPDGAVETVRPAGSTRCPAPSGREPTVPTPTPSARSSSARSATSAWSRV